MGAHAAGHDVVAIEEDEFQYSHLLSRFTIVAEKYATHSGDWKKVEPAAFHGGYGASNPHMPQADPVSAPARKQNKRPAADSAGEVKAEDEPPKLQPSPVEAPSCHICGEILEGLEFRECLKCGAKVHAACGGDPEAPFYCIGHEPKDSN